MASTASAFLGSTLTHLRGSGLGAEVDDDELRRGDEIRLVPEPSNPRDPNAVTAVTPEGLLVGRIHKRHADAGFSKMLAMISRQNIEVRAAIHSISPMDSTWGGNRIESAIVRIELSFFGVPSMAPLLRRLVQHHGLYFRAASVDASMVASAEAGAGAEEPPAFQAAAVVTSSSSLTSASREGSARGSQSTMAGEVVHLTADSDTD